MMIDPVIGDNWGRQLCKNIVSYCETFFIKQLIYPIVIVLPPTLLMAIVQKPELQAQAAKFVGNAFGASLLTLPSLGVLIIAPFYMLLVKAIYAAIKSYSKPSKELSKDDLISILKAIEIAVNEKAKRMSNSARNALSSKNVSAKDTFTAITQPEQQMSLLINGVHSIFEYLSRNKINYRIGLLKIESNKPTEWLTFHPQSSVPGTSAKALADQSSTVSCCIRSKKMVIVEDIAKELKKRNESRRYLASSAESVENGSQLCYPIVHPATGKIQHVITVAGDKSCSLLEKHAVLYEWILNHFVVRISMEQSLLIMKEKANEQARKSS